MASFIGRLIARFNQQKQVERKKRRAGNRPLRMEPMEFRRLLAGDIGSINGNLYVDLTDNGLDPADGAVVAAPVNLFRDGGNSSYESGNGVAGGDDTLIGTVNSDANGDYRFDNLVAGTYFVEQIVIAPYLQRSGESPKTVVISEAQASGVLTTNVDTYNVTAQVVTAAQGVTSDSSVDTAPGEAIGDERDIQVVNTGLPGAQSLEADTSTGVLIVNTDSGAQGRVIVTYDGNDDDASTINFDSLTSLNADLTAGGATSFHLLATSEPNNSLTINVYSSANDFSSLTVPLPVTGSLLNFENVIVDFADFVADAGGTGADFTNVAAIRMELTIAESADARIDFSQIVTPFVSTQNFQNLNPMSLGDTVFNDINNNGFFDIGEVGVAGVEVQLYQDNGNGIFDDDPAIDPLVDTTTTDSSGVYLFTDLLPGEYIAVIPLSEFATAADPLFGFASSTGNDPVPDPDVDVVDGDDNGFFVPGVGIVTLAITLASGSEPTNDGDADPNSNRTLDFGVTPEIDLALIKTVDQPDKIAGQQVTYTLEIANNGDATAENVLVIDDLPDFMSIVSVNATNGGVVTQTGDPNGEIEISYASLAAQQTETITIIAAIPASQAAATAVVNSASITGDGTELDPIDNADTADIDISRQAALTLTKTDTPDPAVVGSQLTYTILVTNTGPSTATNVVVSDSLPTGLSFVSVNSTAGTASESAGVITVDIPSLLVSGAATIDVVATILPSFAGSTIANTATAEADEASLVTAEAETTINPQIDLEITKSDRTDPTNRGDQLVYDLVVTNNGPSGATNVEVLDTLPAGVTFVSATGGTVTPPAGGSSDVLIVIGNLASGATANLTLTVDVNATAPNSLTNNALVRSTESIAGFDTNPDNNSTAESTSVQSTIDLEINKQDLTDPVVPGENFSYELLVTNNGPSSASSVLVSDNLPDGIRILSATSTAGTVTIPATAQDTDPSNPDDLTVNIPSLASGASATVTINATVFAATRGTNGQLTNVASVASTDPSMIESDTTNNSDSETTTLTPEIDLRIAKVDSVDPVLAGGSLTYTITVTNDGPSTATNVNVSDTIPVGMTFTSANSSQGTTSQTGGVVTASLGSLAPNATATVTILVGVNNATLGSITNTATVNGTEPDTDTTNNTASATTTVDASVDLAITKTGSSDLIAAGSPLTYTLLVTNNGPSAATSVVVTDNLPAGVTFVSGTSTIGTVANVGNNVTASIGNLAAGATATVTLNVNVASTQTADILNTASVDAAENDPVPGNNSSTETTAIAVATSVSGTVFVDVNRNDELDPGEPGIASVGFALAGTDSLGNVINRTTNSDADGNYSFIGLFPGTYTVTQMQPPGFSGETVQLGTGAAGTAGINEFDVVLVATPAVNFNFPEFRSSFSKRLFLNR